MTQEHPITPPPELVQQWAIKSPIQHSDETWAYELFIATQAARWGSDQELEACCDHLKRSWSPSVTIDNLRAHRRPKPPSSKAQAQALLDKNKTRFAVAEEDVIRLALESLPD